MRDVPVLGYAPLRVDELSPRVLTLDLAMKGYRLREVPVRYCLRERGASFVSWRYPAKVLPAVWRELRAL